MRDVPVPAGLHEQILQRLAAERGDRHRRWVAHAGRGLAAAAAVLLAAWGLYALLSPPRTTILADDVLQGGNLTRPATPDKANGQLRKLGSIAGAPAFVNYNCLSGVPALAILPGTEDSRTPVKVPQLVFTHPKGQGQAWVYVVPRKRYKVEGLENEAHGYKYRLDVVDEANSAFIYFILYTGQSWADWLAVPTENTDS
jgi:hypothetical protein